MVLENQSFKIFNLILLRPSSDKLFSDAANRLFLPTRVPKAAAATNSRSNLPRRERLRFCGFGFFIRNVLY